MTDTETLLPCPVPWCLHTDAPHTWQDCADEWVVICPSCSVHGPCCSDESDAVCDWNNLPRASTESSEPTASEGLGAGFTPGPWFVQDEPVLAVVAQEDHPTIAEVTAVSDRDTGEEIANARLIAAAPNGYAVAERLVAHLRDDFRIPNDADEGWIVDTLGHGLGGVYLDALAFLAKASRP